MVLPHTALQLYDNMCDLQVRSQMLRAKHWLTQHGKSATARTLSANPAHLRTGLQSPPGLSQQQGQQYSPLTSHVPSIAGSQPRPGTSVNDASVFMHQFSDQASNAARSPLRQPARNHESSSSPAPAGMPSILRGARSSHAARAAAAARSPFPAAAQGHRELTQPPTPSAAAVSRMPVEGPARQGTSEGLASSSPQRPRPSTSAGLPPGLAPSARQQASSAIPGLPAWLLANLQQASQPGVAPPPPASSAGSRQPSLPPASSAAPAPPASAAGSNPFAAAAPQPLAQRMSAPLPAGSLLGPWPRGLPQPADPTTAATVQSSMALRPAAGRAVGANPFLAPNPFLQPAVPHRVCLAPTPNHMCMAPVSQVCSFCLDLRHVDVHQAFSPWSCSQRLQLNMLLYIWQYWVELHWPAAWCL